ncbi:MAG: hypothetical protein Q9181_008175, partial [Wetmoreana brouardii]
MEDGEIRRSDECRLLYLAGSEDRPSPPISPWQPFGSTPLEYTDLEVRKHAACEGHCLLYQSWRWETKDGRSREDRGFDEAAVVECSNQSAHVADTASTTVPADELPGSEDVSEGATQTVFGWLRPDGYPPNERVIFMHEWFDMGESSDESDESTNGEH